MIGLELDKALELLKDKKVEILYNNCDKQKVFDSQIVVAYKQMENHILLTVCNMKQQV